MESKCPTPEQRAEDMTPKAGNVFPPDNHLNYRGTISDLLPPSGNLRWLIESKVTHDKFGERLQEPLALEQLEMLEAELRNQAILPSLPENTPSLAQAAAVEINLYRWRARRTGVACNKLNFIVDVPRYVASLAVDLTSLLHPERFSITSEEENSRTSQRTTWRTVFTTEDKIRASLEYLELFAAYFKGHFDNPSNGYQRGLNLVLKVLATKQTTESISSVVQENISVCLPIRQTDFHSLIRGS